MAQLRMDAVGEVDGRRSSRHVLDFPFWREDEDLILEDIFDRVDEVLSMGEIPLPFDKLAQPREPLLEAFVLVAAFLVAPVRGHAVLGQPVHLVRADLHLQRAGVQAHHGGMERLVHVLPRVGDVVVELTGHRPPQAVDDAQSAVTVLYRFDQDAQRQQIVDLVEILSLFSVLLDLLVHTIDMFGAALDRCLYPLLL